MLKIIVFLVLNSIVSYILNLFLGNLIAYNIVDFFGAEWGPTIYATIILTVSTIIDYLIVFKVLFKDKGTETIIHDDPPAEEEKKKEEAKKKEVSAEVKEFKEDKFEEVSFLDEAKEVKPDERLIFVQDFEKKDKESETIIGLIKWLFIVIVFVWAVVATTFAYKVYNDFYLETVKTRRIVEDALYKNEFGEEKELDFKEEGELNFTNILTDENHSGLEINRKLHEKTLKEAEEIRRDMKIDKIMEQ